MMTKEITYKAKCRIIQAKPPWKETGAVSVKCGSQDKMLALLEAVDGELRKQGECLEGESVYTVTERRAVASGAKLDERAATELEASAGRREGGGEAL